MNDVKISSVDPGSRAGLASASPQQHSQQVAEVGTSDKGSVQNSKPTEVPTEVVNLRENENIANSQEQKDKQLEGAVTKLNDYIQNVQRDLEFQTDDSSGKTVITVVDRQTAEVVRQIPGDVALRLAQNLQQDEPLSLFNIKV